MAAPPAPEQAPRRYPAMVALKRRSRRFADGDAPAFEGSVEDWLVGPAIDIDDLLLLFEEFLWRLAQGGFRIDRSTLHVGTLHPQLIGYAWNWERGDRLCDEIKVSGAAMLSQAYRENPLSIVMETGITFRARTDDATLTARHPLLRELAGEGYTEYFARPLRKGGRYHSVITLATKHPDGFAPAAEERLAGIGRLLALHVERHIAQLLARNLLATYLGEDAGERVLNGSIRRGDGLPIDAVIWVSDLRGFTSFSQDRAPAAVTAVLNAYFDRIVGAIEDGGGQVLKFMGDGLLAVFALDRFASPQAAAAAALSAARRCASPWSPAAADLPDGRPPLLATGIGLHLGRVFFGNIGGGDRLDFTVIGSAVNTASRIEAETKTAGRPVLVSGDLAELLGEDVEPVGEVSLRGLDASLRLYAARLAADGV